jgi:hypothetical protein
MGERYSFEERMSFKSVIFECRRTFSFLALVPLSVAWFGAATPSPEPSASDPPNVAQLRAKIDAARGKRPFKERIVEVFDEDGRASIRTTIHEGDDERIREVDGPFVTESGTFGGQDWHQNENGLTVLDQPRPGAEAEEKRTLTLRHITSPIVADVIADLDPKGDGTKTYVDPATSRIVRIDHIRPNETYVTTYDDFRREDGYERAWHEHTSDGLKADERDVRVVSIETANITPDEVTITPPRRALVVFPDGTHTAQLPAHLDSENHWIVRLQVGSRGLDFILDTGTAGIMMDEGLARSLGLRLYTKSSNSVNAGRYIQSATIVPRMNVGPLTMTDVAVKVVPDIREDDPDSRSTTVGVLGFDFIASMALALDYEHGLLTATDYRTFTAPSDAATITVPIRVGNQAAETDVWLDGRLGEHFEIVTGGVGGIMITDQFTRGYPGITRTFVRSDGDIEIDGVGGEFSAPAYVVPEVRIGNTAFKTFPAIVIGSDRIYSFGGFDGYIGPEILRYFTVTTNYADSTVYLSPNKLGHQARFSGPAHSR